MIGGAAKLATLPLRRRLIGSGILLVGVLLVLLGFFLNLTSGPVHNFVVTTPSGSTAVTIPIGSHTAADNLKHTWDHGLLSGNTVRALSDAAVRAGVVGMAAAAALAALALVVSPLRGFVGLAAGVGLMGDAVIAGVLFGSNVRLTADFSHVPGMTIDLGPALWVLAAGFVAVLVGGALAAWRPLAGLFTGVSLAITGAGLGAGLALLVGGNRLAGG